jgi:hypothetical protein
MAAQFVSAASLPNLATTNAVANLATTNAVAW